MVNYYQNTTSIRVCLVIAAFCVHTPLLAQRITWESFSDVPSSRVTTCESGSIFAGSDNGILYRSVDQGDTWGIAYANMSNVNNRITSIICFDSSNVMVARDPGGILVSEDNGDTWQQSFSEDATVYTLHVNSDNVIYAGVGSGVARSEDKGLSWGYYSYSDVNNIAIAYGFAETIDGHWFACALSQVEAAGAILGSSYNGDSWHVLLDNIGCTNIVVDSDNRIYATHPIQGLLVSTDQGTSWSIRGPSVNDGLAMLPSIFLSEEDVIYVGSSHGVIYRSSDKGETWEAFPLPGSGDVPYFVESLALDRSEVLYASLISKTVKGSFSHPSTGQESFIDTKNISVSVFPNPFKESVNITLSHFSEGEMEITIYDALGRERYKEYVTSPAYSDRVFTLSSSQLQIETGLYLISIKSKSNRIVKSIIYID